MLGSNGLIYFVPSKANNIGVLNPSSSSFTTIDISNTTSSAAKYSAEEVVLENNFCPGGNVGPNGGIRRCRARNKLKSGESSNKHQQSMRTHAHGFYHFGSSARHSTKA